MSLAQKYSMGRLPPQGGPAAAFDPSRFDAVPGGFDPRRFDAMHGSQFQRPGINEMFASEAYRNAMNAGNISGPSVAKPVSPTVQPRTAPVNPDEAYASSLPAAPAPQNPSPYEYFQEEDTMGRKSWSTRPTGTANQPGQSGPYPNQPGSGVSEFFKNITGGGQQPAPGGAPGGGPNGAPQMAGIGDLMNPNNGLGGNLSIGGGSSGGADAPAMMNILKMLMLGG